MKKNRALTTVSGFGQYESIKMKDFSRKIAKKFGCGAGAVTKDSFELQGLYKDSLMKHCIEELKDLNLKEEDFKIEEKLKNEDKKRIIN